MAKRPNDKNGQMEKMSKSARKTNWPKKPIWGKWPKKPNWPNFPTMLGKTE